MPDPISWYALGRDVGDPQTILEAVDEKILTHNLDPSAHGQSDEAIYMHRISTMLDHVNYSIYNIKLHPETRPIKAFVDVGGAAEFSDLNSAIEYVNALGGGHIFVKSGTYHPGNNITLYSNIQIEGEDRDSAIFDFDGLVKGFRADGSAGAHLHNIKLDNIQITGSGSWEDGCVLFNYVDDADIFNCKFYDNYNEDEWTYAPVVIANCTEIGIKNNYFNLSRGVIVTNGGNKITVEDNYFYNFNAGAFYVNAATLVIFRHNYLDGTEDDAIDIAWNQVIVDGNIFINCSATCILIDDDNNIIVNNILISPQEGTGGIWTNSNIDRCIIANNRFLNHFASAIYCNSGVGHVISGNICESADAGVIMSAGANYSSIVGNVFRGCLTPISDSGTGNQKAGNVI